MFTHLIIKFPATLRIFGFLMKIKIVSEFEITPKIIIKTTNIVSIMSTGSDISEYLKYYEI